MKPARFPQSVGATLFLAATLPAFASEPPAADQVVAAIEGIFGATHGERRNHTKGLCATGEFVGNKAVAAYSRSPLFSGKPLPVIARFSLSGGNPKAPDTAKSGRGMALQFQLPKGQLHQMAMLNTPMFGAATPQTFLDLMLASKPDPATGKPDPEKLKAFKESHPDNAGQAQYLAANNPPASFASSSYWGIHTFKFVNKKNRETLVRWQFVPQDGEQRLSDDELKTAGADFLAQKLIERAKQGPVCWDMMLTIGQPGDPQDDPTQPWPDGRQRIKAGTLTIGAAMPQQGGVCETINYDPLVMADGIRPTNDPVLLFRSPAYAVSFGKRMSER